MLSFVVPVPHREDHGVKIGDTKIGVQTEHSEKLPPAVGGILLAGGVLALVVGAAQDLGWRNPCENMPSTSGRAGIESGVSAKSMSAGKSRSVESSGRPSRSVADLPRVRLSCFPAALCAMLLSYREDGILDFDSSPIVALSGEQAWHVGE